MLYAIDSFQLYLEEAQLLIREIGSRSDDPTLALSKILLRMKSSFSAMKLMHCYTANDILKIRRLKQRLGNAYYPIVGLYSGYYILDLSLDTDRRCLKKLIEKSVRNVETRRKNGFWDTSQEGNWSCFRNEYHYPIALYGERRITPHYFYPIPHKGKVEFDFVNIDRPDPAVCRPADHDRIIDVSVLFIVFVVFPFFECLIHLLFFLSSLIFLPLSRLALSFYWFLLGSTSKLFVRS
jgi:hypothetical protein